MSNVIVGIDLGTTNSLIGVMDAGFAILLADAEGHRLTPSVVTFPTGNGAPLVGRTAEELRAAFPKETVFSVKRFMGARVGELATIEAASGLPYEIVGVAGAHVRIKVDPLERMTWSPEEISSFVLKKLKADAEAALGVSVTRAVITVPAYFNDAQRAATVAAGSLAGLQVERIINEPTAAALAYGLSRLKERSKIAVYDLGGGTFDISILELNAGVFQVLSTNGNTRLGGDDIDYAFAELIAQRLGASDPGQWRTAAKNAKVDLSVLEQVVIDLATEGTVTLHRTDLEIVARPIIERTRTHCLRALADARLSPGELDAVILVGGATRMPLVRQFVAETFGREPDTSQNPDEAVAIGATIQAGILSGAVRDVVLLDVTPLSLGIETFGGLINVIIPRNSTIPIKAGEMFTNAVAGQSGVRIHVVQGERERAADNWTLGAFELGFDQPGPRGSARVGVQFEIDANGILHVLARDTKTGAERIVELRSAVDVSDEAVEQMISESVDHAFEDYHARLFVETRLKSEEMLPAVRQAISMFSAEDERLSASERNNIERLIQDVESALQKDNYEALKAANAALDAGTQHLATLLMERAMDDALRRRGLV